MGKPAREITAQLHRTRRRLPHWQVGGSTYFVTFRCVRGVLPEEALKVLPAHLLHDHGKKYDLHFGVIMPDHVHLIIQPRQVSEGVWHDLKGILGPMKGASAHSINRVLGTKGRVWEDESFDRIIRHEKEYEEKVQYMWNNPVKAGLVGRAEEWGHFMWKPLASEE